MFHANKTCYKKLRKTEVNILPHYKFIFRSILHFIESNQNYIFYRDYRNSVVNRILRIMKTKQYMYIQVLVVVTHVLRQSILALMGID